MATSKTLTPTNVTIQIPAFTDKPDQRLNSNCIDKEADAINALSDQIAKMSTAPTGALSDASTSLSAYPIGFNVFRIGAVGTWPLGYATVITFRADANYGLQIIANYQSKMQFRTSEDGTVWSSWFTIL